MTKLEDLRPCTAGLCEFEGQPLFEHDDQFTFFARLAVAQEMSRALDASEHRALDRDQLAAFELDFSEPAGFQRDAQPIGRGGHREETPVEGRPLARRQLDPVELVPVSPLDRVEFRIDQRESREVTRPAGDRAIEKPGRGQGNVGSSPSDSTTTPARAGGDP